MRKHVVLHHLVVKEMANLSSAVTSKFYDLFVILRDEGKLQMPFAKKLGAGLFEIRVNSKGEWRAIYTYRGKKDILILSVFRKKTRKTPLKVLDTALKRLSL